MRRIGGEGPLSLQCGMSEWNKVAAIRIRRQGLEDCSVYLQCMPMRVAQLADEITGCSLAP